jgi:hypothetical protein
LASLFPWGANRLGVDPLASLFLFPGVITIITITIITIIIITTKGMYNGDESAICKRWL